MKILFVCTGNTCRSPMAEGIFKRLIKEENLNIKNEDIKSVGLITSNGILVNEKSVNALKKLNIDISKYKSNKITEKDIDEADIVLTMTKNHKEMIIRSLDKYSKKIFTLNEYIKDIDEDIKDIDEDIKDPFGLSQKIYDETSLLLYKKLKKLVNKLKKEGY